MKYSGLSTLRIEELDEYNIPHDNGVVIGTYVITDFICGNLIENVNGKSTFEWFTRVHRNTIEKIKL